MKTTDIYTTAGAAFSPCRRWRYTLFRRWSGPKPGMVNFIGLNPSTADERTDDNTVRRCVRWAYEWGWSGCCVTNIFAYRSTDPKALYASDAPIGVENDRHLVETAKASGLVIAAWGVHGAHLNRGQFVATMLTRAGIDLQCLGVTKAGIPRHPLYLPSGVKPIPFILP